MLFKQGKNDFVKSIDQCQPAQSAQADMDRKIVFATFTMSASKRVFLAFDSVVV